MIQLVEYGNQLLVKRQIQESRQKESEDVQRFSTTMIHPLHCPEPPFASFDNCATFETQRSQSRLHTPLDNRSSLCKGDCYLRHPNVPKCWMTPTNIFAQGRHRMTEIKVLLHCSHSLPVHRKLPNLRQQRNVRSQSILNKVNQWTKKNPRSTNEGFILSFSSGRLLRSSLNHRTRSLL